AFADQKVHQVATLARGLAEGADAIRDELDDAARAYADRIHAPGVRIDAVRERTGKLTAADAQRVSAPRRDEAQAAVLDLPPLPTTTIGSFPQTSEIRRLRAGHDRGERSTKQYHDGLREEIARVIRLQEELGLDVL